MNVRKTMWLPALCVAIAILSSACRPSTKAEQPSAVDIRVERARIGTSQLHPGITHTQFSVHPSDKPAAVDAASNLISGKKLYQNQHIMGWGALNPMPRRGVYDWNSLDQRMELIRQTGGIAVITLCCAPDWMKGGAEGATDWSKINEAPTREHFGDFAALAGEVAKRYPDVKYYQVWHGLKGFYNRSSGAWDYRSYTELYNAIYRELKSIDSTIQVGGPVITADSWSDAGEMQEPSKLKGRWGTVDQRVLDAFTYWLVKKEGANFISLDMGVPNKDRVELVDPFAATEKLVDVAKWVRSQSDLPLWVARWNPFPADARDWGLVKQEALLATAYLRLASSNVQVELLWQPQAKGAECVGCLWTDTRVPAGGQKTSSFSTLDALASNFPPGTSILRSSSTSKGVMAVSSPDLTAVINHRSHSQRIRLNGFPLTLDPFEVRLLPRPTLTSN